MSSFNFLLGGVAKVKHYDYVISFHVANDGSSKFEAPILLHSAF